MFKINVMFDQGISCWPGTHKIFPNFVFNKWCQGWVSSDNIWKHIHCIHSLYWWL